MQVFPGNYFNTKLRIRFLGSILMFLEFARLRQACGDQFFFQHEILPCTQLHLACFLAWTDRNYHEENRDFWTHKWETLYPIHVVCIANIYSLSDWLQRLRQRVATKNTSSYIRDFSWPVWPYPFILTHSGDSRSCETLQNVWST